jgi:hypothetical protein
MNPFQGAADQGKNREVVDTLSVILAMKSSQKENEPMHPH